MGGDPLKVVNRRWESLAREVLCPLTRGCRTDEGKSHPKIAPAVGNFAPRLADLHAALDRAVCDAYGWEYAVPDDEEEILRRRLTLNLERAGNAG